MSSSSTVFDPAYAALAGTHRIQRVPAGEKSGRRHSSEVTVVVLDDATVPNRPRIDPADVDESFVRASGPGGQHRNKVSSGVVLVHRPTGTKVTATEERSQYQNRQVAWGRLEQALGDQMAVEAHEELNADRSSSFGGPRNFTWTAWRDEVKGPGVKTSMSRALAGKIGPLLR